jgi:tRNA pseudouridine55 synthase
VGEENKKRKYYEFFTKEYIYKSILGLKTDTYDILGVLSKTGDQLQNPVILFTESDLRFQLQKIVEGFVGKFQQPYPPYSSCRVNGKLLFQWAREGKLDEIVIPSKEIEVMSMEILSLEYVTMTDLYGTIAERIGNVTSGDFRQEEILGLWKELSQSHSDLKLPVVEIKANVSHGTYVRSLSHEMGNKLGTGAVVFDLLRSRVQDFYLKDSIYLI